MRRRSSVLLPTVLALLAGAVPAAAQEPPPPEAVATPVPAAVEPPVTEPVAAPPAAPAPAVTVAAPAAAEPEGAPAPDPAPPAAAAPAPVATPATPPPAPVPAAAPAPRRAAAPTVKRSARQPRTAARAPNQEQRDGRLVAFDGRVTVGPAPPAPCATDDCALADYEIRDLEVRSDPGGPALIAVTRARARGSASDRSVEAEVMLRPPGGDARTGRLTLGPTDDLLDPATYQGTSLEDVIGEVLAALAPLTGPGGALENLSIKFGPGFVTDGRVDAVAVSTRNDGFVVTTPLAPPRRPGSAPPPPVLPMATEISDSGDPGADPQVETDRALVRPPGAVLPSETNEGGGAATAVADFATSVFGALVTGACEAVGSREDCAGKEPLPAFVVDLLTAVLFVSDEGQGQVELRCPAGYEGVRGTLTIAAEIRAGQTPRLLAAEVRFDCDEPVADVRVRLLPAELRRLEDEGRLTARLTVIATATGGARDSDVVAQATIRLRSRENAPG
jgi:hypothetical protein